MSPAAAASADIQRGTTADRPFWLKLGLVWLVVSALLVYLARANIAAGVMADADDYMRLQQVRDLLAGQSWFDLHQYRYVPPGGGPMHWTRLVDLPIAAVILLFKPLLGAAVAERLAEILVPLFTLGCVMALIATITRRLVSESAALLAAALLPTAPLLWVQIQPMRIDHHGWQVVASLVMAIALFDRKLPRGGIIAGIAAAIGATISVEGLPFAVAVGGLFAWRWARDDQPGVEQFAWALAATALACFIAMQPISDWGVLRCDTVGPPYLAGFVAVALGVALSCRLPLPRSLRLPALAVAGAAGAAAVLLVHPACRAGPLAEFDPLIYRVWFRSMREGLPVWDQSLPVASMILGFPVIGAIGSWWARRNAEGPLRQDWETLLWLQVASIFVAAMTQRAGAVEGALALIGSVALTAALLRRIDRLRHQVVRIIVSAATVMLLTPLALPAMANIAMHRPSATPGAPPLGCNLPERLARLDSLPPADIVSTFDLSAMIVSVTHHRVLATGHHRNMRAMDDLILAFTRPPAEAHAILQRHGIDYLVLCRDSNEVAAFSQFGAGGLMDRLEQGHTPAWLRPVRIEGAAGLDVWQIL